MTTQDAIDLAELQDRLAAKESECRELRKELHELRSHALQNKLATAELFLGERPKQHSTDKTENPASSDA